MVIHFSLFSKTICIPYVHMRFRIIHNLYLLLIWVKIETKVSNKRTIIFIEQQFIFSCIIKFCHIYFKYLYANYHIIQYTKSAETTIMFDKFWFVLCNQNYIKKFIIFPKNNILFRNKTDLIISYCFMNK